MFGVPSRNLRGVMAAMRLLSGAADLCTKKILVAAKYAGIELVVEAPRSAIPELHYRGKVIRYTNAILRHVSRSNQASAVYGSSFFESAEVDSWLDWTELEMTEGVNVSSALNRLESHLLHHTFLVGQRLSIADISLSLSLSHLSSKKAPGCTLQQSTSRWLNTCLNQREFLEVCPSGASFSVPGGAGASASAAPPAAASGGKSAAKGEVLPPYCNSAVGGRLRIRQLLETPDQGESFIGQRLTVCGWAKTARLQGKGAFYFVELNDGSSPLGLQVVVDNAVKGFEALKGDCGLGTGASLKCTGIIVKSGGKGQKIEMLLKEPQDEVLLFGGVDGSKYPLAKKEHSHEFLRENAHLRPRTNLIGCIARVRSSMAMATHEFFRNRGFLYVHTPCITGSDCEGAGEMFQVTTLLGAHEKREIPRLKDGHVDYSKDFFGKVAGLTVSGQLNVENYCCALSDVYTFGPTFRAENSHTSRHLAEFWMIEPELAFADLFDDMSCAEDYLKYCVKYALDNNRSDLEFFNKQTFVGLIDYLETIIKEPFQRCSYTEAVDILMKEKKAKFENKVEWGVDLASEHERWLTEKVFKKPTIVYNYPKDIKAFYMRLNDDEKTVAAMDVLLPRIGEVIGGAQREERLDVLDRRLKEMNLNEEDYWWYRDLRKFGSVPHAGFGLGFERLVMLVTGVENIRDVIPFPRYPGHAEF